MSKLRLGVIGNSHLAALKKGWSRAGGVTGRFEPSFWAAGGARLSFRVEGARLVAADAVAQEVTTTSGCAAGIDVGAFDAFLLVGLMFGLRRVVEIYRSHRLFEHAGRDHQLLSYDALERAIHGLLADSNACRIHGQIRGIRDVPCVVVPEPLPSAAIASSHEAAELWGGEFIPLLHAMYRGCVQRISAERGIPIAMQPDTLIEPPCFTPDRFAVGSMNLRQAVHPPSERFHMNEEFGARMLEIALPSLASRAGAPLGGRFD